MRSEKPIIMCSSPSLRNVPNTAFQRESVFDELTSNVPDRKERHYALVLGFRFCCWFLEDIPSAGAAPTPCVFASTQNTINIKYKGSENAQNATCWSLLC